MGEHKIPRERPPRPGDAPIDDWMPPFARTSCANCFWNWLDKPQTDGFLAKMPMCHLMPRQMLLTTGNRLAGAVPGIIEPNAELCGGWKLREVDGVPWVPINERQEAANG